MTARAYKQYQRFVGFVEDGEDVRLSLLHLDNPHLEEDFSLRVELVEGEDGIAIDLTLEQEAELLLKLAEHFAAQVRRCSPGDEVPRAAGHALGLANNAKVEWQAVKAALEAAEQDTLRLKDRGCCEVVVRPTVPTDGYGAGTAPPYVLVTEAEETELSIDNMVLLYEWLRKRVNRLVVTPPPENAGTAPGKAAQAPEVAAPPARREWYE